MRRLTVSVVLPTFKPDQVLREALASVIGQSLDDWELIVVDDGSGTDLSWIPALDPRILVLESRHAGVSVARNLGIAAATGEFVAFLDQDDRWHHTKLERQVQQTPRESVFSYTAFDLIDAEGNVTGPGYGREVSYLDMLAGELGVLQSATMVRRRALESVGGYDPTYRMQQDLDLALRLARFGPSSFVPSTEVDYRLHSKNASRDYWLASQEHLLLLELHRVEARAAGDHRAAEAARLGARRVSSTYAHQAIDAARRSWAVGERADVPVALYHSLRLAPRVVAQSAAAWVGARVDRDASGRRLDSSHQAQG